MMFGRRFRSKSELRYLLKHEFLDSWYIPPLTFWTVIMISVALILHTTWKNDFPNWYGELLGFYFGVLIAIIVHFRSKKIQNIVEAKLQRIEGIINSQHMYGNKILNSQFQLFYALDGIIEIYAMLRKESKKWKKTKDDSKKEFFKQKILYVYEKSIVEFAKILDNQEIVSDKMFELKDIEELHKISVQCKIRPEFDEKNNKIIHHNFHHTVVQCILLLDKLKIDSKFRGVLLKY